MAARADVTPQTLRFYEQKGLLAEPPRSSAGYRAYPLESVQRVRFIKQAQLLGFTLAEVQILLHLSDGGPSCCDDARELAAEKIKNLKVRIDDLQSLWQELVYLVQTCGGVRGERECPIIQKIHRAAQSGIRRVGPGGQP